MLLHKQTHTCVLTETYSYSIIGWNVMPQWLSHYRVLKQKHQDVTMLLLRGAAEHRGPSLYSHDLKGRRGDESKTSRTRAKETLILERRCARNREREAKRKEKTFHSWLRRTWPTSKQAVSWRPETYSENTASLSPALRCWIVHSKQPQPAWQNLCSTL